MNRNRQTGPGRHRIGWSAALGLLGYLLLLVAFWEAAHYFRLARPLRGHLFLPFLALAAMLAVFWGFGWGLDAWLRRRLRLRLARLLVPGAFCLAVYALLSLPLDEFRLGFALVYWALPTALAALLLYLPPGDRFSWQDAVTLAALGLPIEYGWLRRALPQPGLGDLPKFLLADLALYLYLIVRPLPGVGFDLRAHWSDFKNGVREWAWYTPIAIGLGFLLGFIRFHPVWPGFGRLAGAALVTFLFVALPEELFFRGLLQNLFATRLPPLRAQALAAAIFGLAHYVHGPVFNWRYVILAAIAGWFYGNAWRRQQRLAASATTHALVDVIWGAWFRK